MRRTERALGRTQNGREWDGVSDGDDRDRPQMAGGPKALTGASITKDRALAARISYLSVLDSE